MAFLFSGDGDDSGDAKGRDDANDRPSGNDAPTDRLGDRPCIVRLAMGGGASFQPDSRDDPSMIGTMEDDGILAGQGDDPIVGGAVKPIILVDEIEDDGTLGRWAYHDHHNG